MKTATAYFWLSSPFVETTIDDRQCDSTWFFEHDDKEQKRRMGKKCAEFSPEMRLPKILTRGSCGIGVLDRHCQRL